MAKVTLEHVSFRYPIYEVTGRSLKVSALNWLKSGAAGARRGQIEVQALTDVSMSITAGDRIGLIGRNGSGKSTLMRLIAGLGFPQSGQLTTEGRIIPLIEKGLGINLELSGQDNIELPLRLLGATTKEVKAARREIPEFTGLGPFMHLPVRTYSEGMKTRLAFAICTALAGDILVLDEWLGAGDIDFYQRAQTRLEHMLRDTSIVVVASHSADLIRQVCNKAAWLDRGRLMMIGAPNEVIAAYSASVAAPAPRAVVSNAA